MAFEIYFKYYERREDGTYDTTAEKTLKRTLGKQFEDISLEQLAKLVFGQLARRDIWIVDTEAWETKKHKISFKETKDGILLKNKKFSFDLTCEDIPVIEDIPETPIVTSTALVAPLQQKPPTIKQQVIRYEIYDPHPDIARAAKIHNKDFTVGKKYPIYEEKPASQENVLLGMLYITEDDAGNRRSLGDKHFVPIINILENNFEPDIKSNAERERTNADTIRTNMPAIYTLGR